MLGEALGIVPVLNIAAGMTALTGLIALLFLPAEIEAHSVASSV